MFVEKLSLYFGVFFVFVVFLYLNLGYDIIRVLELLIWDFWDFIWKNIKEIVVVVFIERFFYI